MGELTTLESLLIVTLFAEASISSYFWLKVKKRLDKERKEYETKRTEYERLIEALPIGRNLL